MDKEQRVAFIISQSICAMIEALGMISDNIQAHFEDRSVVYAKGAFDRLIERSGISYNDAISYLRD